MWYSLHSLHGWSPFLPLFICLEQKKKTLCSWLTLCFGCISFCVGWENVAEVASGKLVQCCFWLREPMGLLQPTCGCVSVVCKNHRIHKFCVSRTPVFPHLQVRFSKIFYQKAELFSACNTRHATEWESSRLHRQWIPLSYEMKVTESWDFRRLEQLTEKPPKKTHLRSRDDGVKPSKPGHKKKSNPNRERGEETQKVEETTMVRDCTTGPISILAGGRAACWRCLSLDAGRGPLWKFSFPQIGGLIDAPALHFLNVQEKSRNVCAALSVEWFEPLRRNATESEKPMSTISMRLAPQSHYRTARYFICRFSPHSMKLDVFTRTTGASSSICK